MTTYCFRDLGLIDFKQAWEIQEKTFHDLVKCKMMAPTEAKEKPNYLFCCEHPHVFTLGKSGMESNLLIRPEFLQSIDATYYKINRGGDITYHGPGQLVFYPIFDLEQLGIGIKKYVDNLEEVIIRCLQDFEIHAGRLEGATGVWLDTDKKSVRKIAAIGVKSSRYVSMHGFALNVNTDLKYFSYINPCGFTDKAVTSMEKEKQLKMDVTMVKQSLLRHFEDIFSIRFFLD